MTQILTGVSLLALVGLLVWGYADRLFKRQDGTAGSERPAAATDAHQFDRPIYKAPAHDFLRGAADLTFGVVILGLGFFMLLWVIANG